MKDNFSSQSAEYARFRPGYPVELFTFLFSHCQNFDRAWDCATGNGQIAVELAERFALVEASDISENQLNNARQRPNIRYSAQAAEAPLFPDASFDLITVGQAVHWFDFDLFYLQVRRLLKPGGLLALVGYNVPKFDEPAIDSLISDLYRVKLGPYWDAERHHVDAEYSAIPFPFDETEFPNITMRYTWTRDQLTGYLGTWSALQHFRKQHDHSALEEGFLAALENIWPDASQKTLRFPIFGRVGKY